MDKSNVVLIDKYFEYSSTRGLNGKQAKMLQALSKELCKAMTQDIVDEINKITMGLVLGTINKEEAGIKIYEIKNKMFGDKKNVAE